MKKLFFSALFAVAFSSMTFAQAPQLIVESPGDTTVFATSTQIFSVVRGIMPTEFSLFSAELSTDENFVNMVVIKNYHPPSAKISSNGETVAPFLMSDLTPETNYWIRYSFYGTGSYSEPFHLKTPPAENVGVATGGIEKMGNDVMFSGTLTTNNPDLDTLAIVPNNWYMLTYGDTCGCSHFCNFGGFTITADASAVIDFTETVTVPPNSISAGLVIVSNHTVLQNGEIYTNKVARIFLLDEQEMTTGIENLQLSPNFRVRTLPEGYNILGQKVK